MLKAFKEQIRLVSVYFVGAKESNNQWLKALKYRLREVSVVLSEAYQR